MKKLWFRKLEFELKVFHEIVLGAWRTYIIAVALAIAAALLSAISPYLMGEIIDRITGQANTDPNTKFREIVLLLLLITVAQITSGLENSVADWMSATKAENISHQIRDRLSAAIFHERMDHWAIKEQARGKILSLYNRDIESLWDLLGYVITEMVSSVVLVITLCAIVVFIAPTIGIVFLIFTAVFAVAYFDNGCRIRKYFSSAAPIIDKMIGLTNSLVEGYETVVAFRKQGWARNGIAKLSENVADLANRAHLRSTVFSFTTGAITTLGVLIVWIVSLPGLLGSPTARVQVTLGELVAILFYFNMISRPLEAISGAARGLSKGLVSLSRLAEFVYKIDASDLL